MDDYERGRQNVLAELMEYTYGMLTTEKLGLQHKIKSMMETSEPQMETQTETQNSNLTFEIQRTMLDCYTCIRYESDDECIECRYERKEGEE